MKAVIIITIAFVLLAPTTVFGAEGYFQSNWGKILSHEPVVCLFQPNDIEISDDIWKRYVTEMKTGIHSWNQALRQLGNGYWTLTIVEVPQNKLSLLNEYQCDIPVKFTKEINADNPNWLGWAYSNGDILLKYHRYEYCGTEYNSEYHITINKRCFSNDLERPKYVASVLQHEIGHTLGLGHYVGYDSRATQQWYDHGIGMPSIMTHQTSNEELKTVTKI